MPSIFANQPVIETLQRFTMDVQYYKRLFISISGIYSVYLTFGLIQEKMWSCEVAFIA